MLGFGKKKKDNGFELDNETLPSLSEQQGNSNPQQPSTTSSSSTDSSMGNGASSLPELPELPKQGNFPQDEYSNHADADLLREAEKTPPMQSMNNSGFQNPFEQEMNSQQSQMPQNGVAGGKDFNSELLKTKIDSMENHLNLLDAKFSNLDKKLEVIYQMIAAEVSDETKKRLRIKSMMDEVKQ
ncbi:MAG: hypothetical protein ACOCXG_03675 [Nanoarchaeota archaeon]